MERKVGRSRNDKSTQVNESQRRSTEVKEGQRFKRTKGNSS